MATALTPLQIARAARDGGIPVGELVTAVAVALGESGGNPDAHNAVPPDDSWGLWQINMRGTLGPDRRRKLAIPGNDALRDPVANARGAALVLKEAGGKWGPWSVYANGTYRKHLPEAQAAVAELTAPPAAPAGGVSLSDADIARIAVAVVPAVLGAKFREYIDEDLDGVLEGRTVADFLLATHRATLKCLTAVTDLVKRVDAEAPPSDH